MGKTNWKPMEAIKFGYDVAYVRTTVRTPTTCKLMLNVRLSVWRGSVPASCEANTNKESIKTKMLSKSIKLKLIVMPQNLEYRERERQKKRESRATGQRSSMRKRAGAREKKQRRHFLLEERHEIL